jgi:chromosome segregation ATPase
LGTLVSPDFALSSEEALQVLKILGDIELVSVDWTMLKTPIGREIDDLKKAEDDFTKKLTVYEETDSQWIDVLQKQESARHELSLAKKEELEAQKVLLAAQVRVAEAKGILVASSNTLKSVEQQVRKNASEMDRVTVHLANKQDRVRNAIRKKASDRIKQETHINMTEEELSNLRRREIQLMGESTQLQRMVLRLMSKAESLKSRASTLDRWQKGEEQQDVDGMGMEVAPTSVAT